MSDPAAPEVHIWVSETATGGGMFLQRHVFVDDLDRLVVRALCEHLAPTERLRPDDVEVPMCPICELLYDIGQLE